MNVREVSRMNSGRQFVSAADARQSQAAQWTEAQFQSLVIDLARRLGWRCYHTHDSRRSVPGFPDLVLVHADHGLMFRELKRANGGRVTPQQHEWLDALTNAGQNAAIWKPQHYLDGTILKELTGKKA